MLDSKIESVKLHYGIAKLEDWCAISPAQVMAIDGVGKATLDYIRLLLAGKDLTLRGDMTPAYWKAWGAQARVGHQLGGNDEDVGEVCPFTIVIDTREQHPYSFTNFYTNSAEGRRPLLIRTSRETLRTGDYSILGMEDLIAVERKSLSDLYGTLGTGRERFERELARFAKLRWGAVVIEAGWDRILSTDCPECGGAGFHLAEETVVDYRITATLLKCFGTLSLSEIVREMRSEIDGKRKCDVCGGAGKMPPLDRVKLNPRSVSRSIIAWEQRIPHVHWITCPTRTFAEQRVFRMLERFWNDVHCPPKPVA